MATVVYNVPVNLIDEYRGRKVIVRSHDAAAVVKALSNGGLENLVAVQLLSLITSIDPLAGWGYGIPVELVMDHPQTAYPLLYRHAKLLDKHPLRVCIPVVPGFGSAVKVATSLQFIVKLNLLQPAPEMIEELREVLDFYLHHPSVSQPIEFFHSTLLSFYDRKPATLWDIQEEDPAYIRFIADDGAETIARQPAQTDLIIDADSYLADLQRKLLAERAECCECEFFDNCGGYFKWPRKDYGCQGVKTVFQELKGAADALQRDVNSFSRAQTEAAR